jgi:DNA-binding HxlR family transcriptional regulator
MPTNRSYADACAIARALDVVGERWSFLVVRELLFGPLRFSDLRRALPNASSNMIADRLRELEGSGVVRRRKLPAPAGSSVYELTAWGGELEQILLALGNWAMDVPLPPAPRALSASSVMLFLRGAAKPEPGASSTVYRLELDDRVWAVESREGCVCVRAEEPPNPVASLRTDPSTLNALLEGSVDFDAAVTDGTVGAGGDLSALRRLIRSVAGGQVEESQRG